MNRNIQKILSLVSASAMAVSAVPSALFETRAIIAEEAEYAENELISVIVKVKGDAVLAGEKAAEEGVDYIETADAERDAQKIESNQERVESFIRKLYPELEVGYRYNLLINGFSCEIPENLIGEIKVHPYVEDVKKVCSYTNGDLKMTDAPALGDVPSMYENTGSYGEGEVIAILDSEFDVSHPMFAPLDDKECAITEDYIKELAESEGLSSEIDAESVYVSSKVPFLFDYGDDTPYDTTDETNYHGTHVAGIAAGNAVKDENGDVISGIAPDAQLVLMKVFTVDETSFLGESYAPDDLLIAALEDSVKLKADVINMSLGSIIETDETGVYGDTLEALSNIGITVCAAAGNDGDNYFGEENSTINADTSTINYPAAYPSVFSVASAGNSYMNYLTFSLNGENIKYGDSAYVNCGDMLDGQKLEYVSCGLGLAEDFNGVNVSGKIALIERGEITFTEKCMNAFDNGAVGVIVYNNIPEEESFSAIAEVIEIPMAFITYDDGQKLLNSKEKFVEFRNSEPVKENVESQISSFSSVGVTASLDLKPEIMGIGGNVKSAAYGNGFENLEGTSMATPYVAGCVALIDEYLKDNGLKLSGSEKTVFIKNLLMNTATKYHDGLWLVSPRRQGAGLVCLDIATQSKVIMTGESGSAKVELRDNLKDNFSFEISLDNFSKEDVTFTKTELCLTTDGYAESELTGENVISGTVELKSQSDLPEEITIEAGKTKKLTVNVSLDKEQLDINSEIFTNGFFIDGYVVLSGSDNSSGISIPLTGYYGSWTDIPLFNTDPLMTGEKTLIFDEFASVYSGLSLSETASKIKEILEDKKININTTYNDGYDVLMEIENAGFEDELMKILEEKDDLICISPDSDGIADTYGQFVLLNRNSKVALDVIDDEGNTRYEGEYNSMIKGFPTELYPDVEIEGLEDGSYTMKINGYIDYPYAEKKIQSITSDFEVDNEKPSVKQELVEKDGKKLLTVTASDKNLEGFYILGASKEQETSSSSSMSALIAAISLLQVSPGLGEEAAENDTTYPILKRLAGRQNDYITELYDYADFVPAYSENEMTVTFDVTDFREYEIAVLDKAYNCESFGTGFVAPENEIVGSWWSDTEDFCGVFSFFPQDWNSFFTSIEDGAAEYFTYTRNGNEITFHTDYGDISGEMEWDTRERIHIKLENGEEFNLFSIGVYGTYSGNDLFTNVDLRTAFANYYSAFISEYVVSDITVESDGYEEAVVKVFNSEGNYDLYRADRFTGYATSADDDIAINLNQFLFMLNVDAWEYNITSDNIMYQYLIMLNREEGSCQMINLENGQTETFEYEYNFRDCTLTFKNDEEEIVNELFINYRYSSDLKFETSDGQSGEGSMYLVCNTVDEYFNYHTNTDYEELILELYNKQHDDPADYAVVSYSQGEIVIEVFASVNDSEEHILVETYNAYSRYSDYVIDSNNNTLSLYDDENQYLIGDTNFDGSIDASDASDILFHYAMFSTVDNYEIEELDYILADVNSDNTIDASDASYVLGYYAYVSTFEGDYEDILFLQEFIELSKEQ